MKIILKFYFDYRIKIYITLYYSVIYILLLVLYLSLNLMVRRTIIIRYVHRFLKIHNIYNFIFIFFIFVYQIKTNYYILSI